MKRKAALFCMFMLGLSVNLQAYRNKEERKFRREVVENLPDYQAKWHATTIAWLAKKDVWYAKKINK